jgi:ribosomal protein S18 acetylase RimI-like enzyme
MPPLVGALRRVPFLPDEVEGWAELCVAWRGPHDAALVRRLLVDLTSDPAGAFVFADGEGPALVCTVVDLAANGAGGANLEILGARATVAGELFAELVVAPAVAFARGGARRGLQVALYPWLVDAQGAEMALAGRGFARVFDSFVMQRPAEAAAPPASVPPLDDGWRWAPLDDERVEAAHSALAETFRGALSFSLAPLHDFRRAVGSGASVWRVLLAGSEIAGLVQVSAQGDRGELRTVGCRPAYRGRGLGTRLVGEGLRVLLARGAREVELEVAADNVRALALYRGFGFEVATRTPVLALPF